MNKKRTGIQITDEGDLDIRDGSLQMGDTLAQNEFALLMSQPGELKEYPLMGAGIADMTGDKNTARWERRVIDAFKDDGLRVSGIEISEDGQFRRLEASYE